MRQNEASSGFTLLEVVVALACTALILGAAVRIFSLGLQTSDSAKMRALGTMLAQSVLAEIAVSDPLTPSEASGVFENGFHWSYRIDLYKEDATQQTGEELAQELQLYRVAVAVSWGRQDNTASLVTLTTLQLSNGGDFPAEEQIP